MCFVHTLEVQIYSLPEPLEVDLFLSIIKIVTSIPMVLMATMSMCCVCSFPQSQSSLDPAANTLSLLHLSLVCFTDECDDFTDAECAGFLNYSPRPVLESTSL